MKTRREWRHALCWYVVLCVACRTPARNTARGDVRRCGEFDPGGPATYTLGPRVLRRDGVVVSDQRAPVRPVTLVALGGPHGAVDDSVLVRARTLGARIARIAPQVMVILGGLEGPTEVVRAWFEVMVPRDVPVLLVPGDRDEVTRFRTLVAMLSTQHHAVLDGTRVRLFAARDLEIATLPGTPWPTGAVASCVLHPSDTARLEAAIARSHVPRLLVSVTAPLQQGSEAIDRGVLGVHVGSRAVAALVTAWTPRGVLSLLPRESAGTLSDLAGTRRLDADTGTEPFALSVGVGGDEPVETVEGALLAGGIWVIRIAPERARVDRLE